MSTSESSLVNFLISKASPLKTSMSAPRSTSAAAEPGGAEASDLDAIGAATGRFTVNCPLNSGRNILVLQRALGHANLTMTMRYAHLAPDHLQEVVKLNPLTTLTLR